MRFNRNHVGCFCCLFMVDVLEQFAAALHNQSTTWAARPRLLVHVVGESMIDR